MTVWALPAAATFEQSAALLGQLTSALAAQGEGALQVDAGALEDFDTSALALLLQARRLAHAAGRPLHVTGAPPKLEQLASLYGVHDLLPFGPAPAATAG